ncbi:hypothetical protein [Streptomyces dysideae]|uniref:hypothetical protein n=1 Tax=Streptomyces dysideae TaxID=909626 RepID=UPI00131C6515|nr:hypothetical protein [Streptomyces dysideae]
MIQLQQGQFAGEEVADPVVSGAGSEVARQPGEVGVVDQDLPDPYVAAVHVPDAAVEPHAPPPSPLSITASTSLPPGTDKRPGPDTGPDRLWVS